MSKKKISSYIPKDSKQRILLLISACFVIGGALAVYIKFIKPTITSSYQSNISDVPSSVKNVPGDKLSPEYLRALKQSNKQNAQSAIDSGQSSVATMINTSDMQGACTSCCCNCDNVDMTKVIDNLLAGGKISAGAASLLQAMQAKDVPVSEFADALDRAVRDGKITPEEARQLLNQYKKAHANLAIKPSADMMDALVKSGKMPLDAATNLLDLQKQKVPVSDYKKQLDKLVKEGKISPETAKALLAQYKKQHKTQAAADAKSALDKLVASGKLSKQDEDALLSMQNKNVPVSDYKKYLDNLVKEGKLTPEQRDKLLAQYRAMHPDDTSESADALNKMVKANELAPGVAKDLLAMQNKHVPVSDYEAYLHQLVKEGKISPEEAAKLLAQYKKAHAQYLAALHSYDGFNGLVDIGGADVAGFDAVGAQAAAAGSDSDDSGLPSADAFDSKAKNPKLAAMQNRMAAAKIKKKQDFNAQAVIDGSVKAGQIDESAQDAQIQALQSAMQNQAGTIFTSWQTPQQEFAVGANAAPNNGSGTTDGSSAAKQDTAAQASTKAAPIIKAGQIMFAVLDTAVNSDYPDTPVMATIVQGKYKGAKLIGKLVTGKNDKQRVVLEFTMLSMPDWSDNAKVSAVAIDPDSAREAMASDVDNHYLSRYGGLLVSSFLDGYADSLDDAGTTVVDMDSGTVAKTSPSLSLGGRVMMGLGEVGSNLGDVAKDNFNRDPTVTIDSGVSLGILFTGNVSAPTGEAVAATAKNDKTKKTT